MPVTKADIQAELVRRQSQPQQADPPPTMGQKAMGAAQDILPYAGGALGAAAGSAAAPVIGPAGPYLGAGLGYGAAKAGLRGINQMMGNEPPQGLAQGLGQASNDVAAGIGMELVPKALAKGIEGGVGLAAKGAKTILPGLLKATANVPQEATKLALDHPGEILNMAAPQAKQVIQSTISGAQQLFGRFIASQKANQEADVQTLSGKIGDTVRAAGNTLEGWKQEAQDKLVQARVKAGIYVPFEKQMGNVLGKNRPTQAKVPGVDKLMQDAFSLGNKLNVMDPMDAFHTLLNQNEMVDRAMASAPKDDTMIALNATKKKLGEMIASLPIDSKTKTEEIAYRKGLQTMKSLKYSFDTPGHSASLQDVTKATDFLNNFAHRIDPKEAFEHAFSTRMAIDQAMPSDMTTKDAAFTSQLRDKLNNIIDRIPGNEMLREPDKAYRAAAEADRMLSDAFTSSTKAKNFVDRVFSGEDPQSPELKKKLLALEERSGQPVLKNLQRLWEERKVVEGAKFPFETEFSNPGSTEKFLHGLFVNGRAEPDARYKLQQVRKIVGTQLVDDMFKGFAADAFHTATPRAYIASRVAGTAASSAAMLPFLGLGHVAPYAAGTAAIASMGSPSIMKQAIKAGASTGGALGKAAQFMGSPGRAMQMMTAVGLLKNRRKEN